MISRFFCSKLIAAAVIGAASLSAAVEPPAAWVGEDWQYRQVVIKEMTNPGLKLDIGSVDIDTQGNIQPDGADIRVTDIWNNIIPYRVASVSTDGRVRVEFQLAGTHEDNAFCVYYGNPAAKPLRYELGTGTGGGIYLTVKAYESGKADTIEKFMGLFNSAKRIIGHGARQNINDQKNPFSEKYERCLAMYTGVIRVPREGAYGFQLKATGPAFVTIDGRTVLSQQLAKGRFTKKDGIQLTRGDHSIKFCLFSRHPSSYIAELYWRNPGERYFRIISPESFPSSLHYKPAARQRFGQIVNSFFSYNFKNKLRLPGTEDILTSVEFSNLSTDSLGHVRDAQRGSQTSGPSRASVPAKTYRRTGEFPKVEWDFGDGKSSAEREPIHVYRRVGEFPVKLTVVNDMGFKDTYNATVTIDRKGAEKLDIQCDLQEETNLIDPGQKEIEIRLTFNMFGIEEKEFLLKSVTSSDGEVINESEELVKLVPRRGLEGVEHEEDSGSTRKIPNYDGSFTVTWSLFLSGIELIKKELRVLEDTNRFPEVSSSDASIVDSEGRHLIVKLTGSPNTEKRKLADVFDADRDKSIKIAIIDNSMCDIGEGWDESKFYYTKLKSLLEEKYPGVEAEIRRFAAERDKEGYFPVRRMVSAAAGIYGLDPDVIIISCDLEDLRVFTPPETLSRYFALMIHNYIANTRAKIVLVTPPPRPRKAHRSKIFATAISKIGLIHEVGLADVYQAVSLYEGDWETLFLDEENPDERVSFLYMNSKGQDIIAQTLFKAIVQD